MIFMYNSQTSVLTILTNTSSAIEKRKGHYKIQQTRKNSVSSILIQWRSENFIYFMQKLVVYLKFYFTEIIMHVEVLFPSSCREKKSTSARWVFTRKWNRDSSFCHFTVSVLFCNNRHSVSTVPAKIKFYWSTKLTLVGTVGQQNWFSFYEIGQKN